MRLLNQRQIESLSKFKSDGFLTTSFFLDADKSRLSKKEITLAIKNLLAEGKSSLEKLDASKKSKESLWRDLEKIKDFCSHHLNSHHFQGLAIFSCDGENFWQVFELPGSPRDRIIFDKNPYVRPLSAILSEHNQICVLAIDRKEARWFEVALDEILLLEKIEGDVPSKVREGGFEGYESKRIERHIDNHLHDHFKNASKKTFELFQNHGFDWLFLGCRDEYWADLEQLLHPYLQKKIKGRMNIKPGDSPNKILKEALALGKDLKKGDEDGFLERYISELKKGGLAVSGLRNTLRSLNRGEVQTLLITRNFTKPGRICPRCRFLYAAESLCPSCSIKTEPRQDVIDEALESALDKRCLVKHINPPSPLRRYGHIGALLRYKA